MPSRQVRLRAACVRCHSQKLRCPERRGKEQNCSRCVKAGEQCVFGVSLRGLRQPLTLASELRTADEMDMDIARSHLRKALPAADDVVGAGEHDALPLTDNDAGSVYTTDSRGWCQPSNFTPLCSGDRGSC
jgi:hypothetical protein